MISVDEVWYCLANAKTDAIPKKMCEISKKLHITSGTIEISNQFQS